MKRNFESLQALRGLAALCIFCSHAHFGNIVAWATNVFFMLSGFLLTYAQLGNNKLDTYGVKDSFVYSMRKTAKLYPLHVLTTFMAAMLTIYEFRYYLRGEFYISLGKKLLSNLLLIQTWFPYGDFSVSLNGVSWFSSVVMFLYFIFPFLLKLIKRFTSVPPVIAFAAVLLILQFSSGYVSHTLGGFISRFIPAISADGFENWFCYTCPLYNTIPFSLGCCLGYIFRRCEPSLSKISVVYGLDILCIIMYWGFAWLYRNILPGSAHLVNVRNILFGLFAFFFLSAFALNKGPLSRLLTNKVTVFIGNISAYFYLIHELIIRGCMTLLTERAIAFHTTMYITIPVSLTASILFSIIWKKYFSGLTKVETPT